jgi:hypothetical protein
LCLFYRKTKERDIVRNGKDRREGVVVVVVVDVAVGEGRKRMK